MTIEEIDAEIQRLYGLRDAHWKAERADLTKTISDPAFWEGVLVEFQSFGGLVGIRNYNLSVVNPPEFLHKLKPYHVPSIVLLGDESYGHTHVALYVNRIPNFYGNICTIESNSIDNLREFIEQAGIKFRIADRELKAYRLFVENAL
jgi:hypothetical protein